MAKLLDKINTPQDLHLLSIDELGELAEEIRQLITYSVSQTGGHLASNLGVIELTIAMHYVFDFKSDSLLWDVGHQCYAHKIITGRRESFSKLRQRGGLSGFPEPDESAYDRFRVGHSGTSIATAIGMALGCPESSEKIVALVGDGSIVNGLSFEAMNNLGLVKRQLLIVLNDNSMAIDVTQGAIAKFLSKIRLSHTYEEFRSTTHNILEHLPIIGKGVDGALENFKKSLRMAISPSRLFESLNIPYFGPVDGHDIGSLIEIFRAMGQLNRPCLLHVYTRKGKGFSPADNDPRKYHSTGPFAINGTSASHTRGGRTFTDAFSDGLVALAEKDERIVAITSAMPDGTGLVEFRNRFPDRYYDVGIAESAAVDIAAGLAKKGKKPMVCIYSTFLQRGFDQIFQEVALANMGVVFCIDRAGVVGSDGPTHHGLMDIGFLRAMPNMTIVSPSDEAELRAALEFAAENNGPVVIRYPRDIVPQSQPECAAPFEAGKSITVRSGNEAGGAIIAFGSVLAEALRAAEILADEGIEVEVVNARFAKPLDERIIWLFSNKKFIITVEDHGLACGFGSAVLEAAAKENSGLNNCRIACLGANDEFVRVGNRSQQLEDMGITAEKIAEKVRTVNVCE
jgi:1-deoxy-D-xylulose-5-phosphate synthase